MMQNTVTMTPFTASDYLPHFNIRKRIEIVVEFVKKLDVQHDQRLPNLQQPLYTPICCASVLFFIWGFAYGLLDTMNSHVRKLMQLSKAMSALMAVAYYAAYPVAVFAIAGPLLKRCGYRITFITGLVIFALGNFVMAAVAGKLIGMVAASFVVGLGVATLERSANPYVVRCGPDRLRATRINFAQSWAGVGTVISPLAAAGSIIGNQSQKLAAIIHVYLTIGCVILGIASFFLWFFFRTQCMPEVPADGDEESHAFRKSPLWSCHKLWWGALGNFCNMGCQVAVAQYLMAYLEENAGLDDTHGAHYLSVAQTTFVVGRFAFCGASMAVKPRKALGLFIFGCIACSTGAIFAKNAAAIAMVVLIMFFEAPLFPTIFETATDGLEKLASRAEDIMISSICGGALLSPLFGLFADSIGGSKTTNNAGVATGTGTTAAGTAITVTVTNNEALSTTTPASTSTTGMAKHAANVINITGTGTAFSLVVASFCVVALYILIINIYKPYRRALDASRRQDKKTTTATTKDTESATSSSSYSGSTSSLPPIMLTTFKSPTVEDLMSTTTTTTTTTTETKKRVKELRDQLKQGGAKEQPMMPSPYESCLEHPATAVLRPSKTCPN